MRFASSCFFHGDVEPVTARHLKKTGGDVPVSMSWWVSPRALDLVDLSRGEKDQRPYFWTYPRHATTHKRESK